MLISPFQRFSDQGRNFESKSLLRQARDCYRKAIESYLERDELLEHLAIFSSLAAIQKRLKMFSESKRTFEKGLIFATTYLGQAKDDRKHILKEKYKLLMNFGLLEVDEADEIDFSRQAWPRFRVLIDSAMKKFLECRQILVSQLNLTMEAWWCEQFIAWHLNAANAIFVEQTKREDKICASVVVQLLGFAEEFYSLVSHHKKEMKEHLNKTFYIKALSLLELKRDQEALGYLNLDFEFCASYPELKEDLLKTKRELLKFYRRKLDFKAAVEHATTRDEVSQLNELSNRCAEMKKKIHKLLNSSMRQVKGADESQEAFLKCLFSELDFLNLYEQIIKVSDFVLRTTSHNSIQYQCYYHRGRAHYLKSLFHEAFESFTEAILTNPASKEDHIQTMLLKAQCIEETSKSHDQIKENYEKLLKDARRLESCRIEEIEDAYRNYQIKIERKQHLSNLVVSKSINQFLDYLRKQKAQRNAAVTSKAVGEGFNGGLVRYEEQKKNLLTQLSKSPLTNYQTSCKQANVAVREYVSECISKGIPIDLFELYSLEEKQLAIILSFMRKNEEVDLRNHYITEPIIRLLHSFSELKHLKLYGICAIECNFNDLLRNQRKLEALSLSHFSIKNISLVEMMLSSCRAERINLLELQDCSLTDQFLSKIKFGTSFIALKTLSLRGNLIVGTGLQSLCSLRGLSSLDLSDNPLVTYKCGVLSSLTSLCLGKLERASQNFLDEIAEQFITLSKLQIYNTKIEINTLFESLITLRIQADANLPHLGRVIVRECPLSDRTIESFGKIILLAPKLTLLDLRGCIATEAIEHKIEGLRYIYGEPSAQLIIKAEGLCENRMIFSLI